MQLLFLAVLLALSLSDGFAPSKWGASFSSLMQRGGRACSASTARQSSAGNGGFGQSFVEQKNFILMEKLEAALEGNLTEAALQYVNFCDESFDTFLNKRVDSAETEDRREKLGRVRYEINSARQKKLIEADKILRGILSAGGLKQMEAKLAFHLRKAEIDMAFMVILQLNIEDAINNKVEKAVQIMTHLETLINEHQDKIVSAPVRLLRLLLRTDDSNVRKQMLRQKLMIGEYQLPTAQVEAASAVAPVTAPDGQAQPTMSPQCEHIVVSAVQSWGSADVTVQQLRDTVSDVLAQMSDSGGEQQTLKEMELRCADLRLELQEVVDELSAARKSEDLSEEDKEMILSAEAKRKAGAASLQ